MAERDDIIRQARLILGDWRGDPVSTRYLADKILGNLRGPRDARVIYEVLMNAAEHELSAFARRAPSEQRKIYGRMTTVRPWLWADYGMAAPASVCPTCGQPIKGEST